MSHLVVDLHRPLNFFQVKKLALLRLVPRECDFVLASIVARDDTKRVSGAFKDDGNATVGVVGDCHRGWRGLRLGLGLGR